MASQRRAKSMVLRRASPGVVPSGTGDWSRTESLRLTPDCQSGSDVPVPSES